MLKLGILGGGQLGRMTAMAAAEYGIDTTIYDPDPTCCAAAISRLFVGAFTAHDTLQQWAAPLDAVTLEFENIPAESLDFLSQYVAVRPDASLLRLAQDRLYEKKALQHMGLSLAPFCVVDQAQDLIEAAKTLNGDLFLKTRRLGYDGKGQVRLPAHSSEETLRAAFATLNAPCIVEQAVAFQREVSIIIARNALGQSVCLPLVENRHEDLHGGGKILRTTLAPAPNTSPARMRQAHDIAQTIAQQTDFCGLLAIEMFETPNGELFVNELAPRPHNSGHWSVNGADISQFHLLVRAALDLPLPRTIAYQATEMTNILGAEASALANLLTQQKPQQWLHLYGKKTAKPGRKMGHINQRLSNKLLNTQG